MRSAVAFRLGVLLASVALWVPWRSAVAQVADGALRQRGKVVDERGGAIERALVVSAGGGSRTRTAADGTFELTGLRPGPSVVEVRRAGYLTARLDVEWSEKDSSFMVIQLDAVQRPATAGIYGIVQDTDGQPVPDAIVVFEAISKPAVGAGTRAETRTDSSGQFATQANTFGTSGGVLITVRRVGFEREQMTVFEEPATLGVTLRPLGGGQQLTTVRVRGRRQPLNISEFRERATRRGMGFFLTPEAVAARNARSPIELLAGIPGMRVQRDPRGQLRAVGRLNCVLAIFVDGFPAPVEVPIDQLFNTPDVTAVEIYTGVGGLPAIFQPASTCGTVGIWTRAP